MPPDEREDNDEKLPQQCKKMGLLTTICNLRYVELGLFLTKACSVHNFKSIAA